MGSRLVALIEEQAALVARAAAPAHDLLESRVALLLLAGGGAHQRHVRGEEHARLHLLTMAQALVALVEALAAVVHRHVAAEVAQVTHAPRQPLAQLDPVALDGGGRVAWLGAGCWGRVRVRVRVRV